MRVLLLVLLILPGLAIADVGKTRFVASVMSYHFERGRGYCEINPGIGLEHEFAKDSRFHVGTYEGSKCRPVSYIGASRCWGLELPFGVRFCSGLFGFQGYMEDRSKILWAPVPALHVPLDSGRGVNIPIFLPHDDFKGGIGLQVTFD